MVPSMFTEALLVVREPRPVGPNRRRARPKAEMAPGSRRSRARPSAPSAKKASAGRARASAGAASTPEGWSSRLREQSHHLARAIEMLEQARTLMTEPRAHSLARAECLRGAGLLTLLAASELLVVAGWFEADQAVSGGTIDR